MWWIIWAIFSLGYAADIKICLSLFVQNDESKIEACLENIPDWVDCVSIYDQGSTDQTLAIVKKFFTDNQILGTIQKQKELELEATQILAIQAAQKMIRMYQWPSENTYILCLDPTQFIKTSSHFEKNNLGDADSYFLLQKTDSFASYEPCLFRASLLWNYNSDDAYWSCETSYENQKCNSLFLEKQPKTAQEIEQLRQTLEHNLPTLHNLFQLAQLYRETKEYEKAILLYQQRIENEEDFEEYWFSKYMLGECYENLDKWDEALYWYLEAYQTGPDRAEPLMKVVVHYRLLGCNDLAYIFAKFGSLLPASNDQIHFSPYPVESYRFDEELSIVSYYTQFKEDGYEAISNLVLRREIPSWRRHHAYRNLLFYVEPINAEFYQPIEIDLPFAAEGIYYHPMNPSILKREGGYTVICRSVNYTQQGAKDFQTPDEKGIYRSRNFVLEYDPSFQLRSQKELVEIFSRERIGAPLVQGLEDCRIFEFQGTPWFSCTTTDTNPTGSVQISLGRLGRAETLVPIEYFMPLKGPDPYRCEKNWLPFVYENQLRMVYQYDPFMIYAPDINTGVCKCVYSYMPEYDFSSFRGSAGPVAFNDGYLILVHEVALLPDAQRVYMHRFLFLNRDWQITQTSKPFIFKHKGVEYCCSMTLDHSGNKLLLPIGLEDREALICFVDCKVVRSMLRPLFSVP